jgi:hypothetical protein
MLTCYSKSPIRNLDIEPDAARTLKIMEGQGRKRDGHS